MIYTFVWKKRTIHCLRMLHLLVSFAVHSNSRFGGKSWPIATLFIQFPLSSSLFALNFLQSITDIPLQVSMFATITLKYWFKCKEKTRKRVVNRGKLASDNDVFFFNMIRYSVTRPLDSTPLFAKCEIKVS